MKTTCEKYSHINVVAIDRWKYFDKCLAMLNTEQFGQL